MMKELCPKMLMVITKVDMIWFDFSLDMQFDTIKVSSFYRDHGVLGCIDNLRNVFLFSINNSLTFLIATMSFLVDYNLHIIVFAWEFWSECNWEQMFKVWTDFPTWASFNLRETGGGSCILLNILVLWNFLTLLVTSSH